MSFNYFMKLLTKETKSDKSLVQQRKNTVSEVIKANVYTPAVWYTAGSSEHKKCCGLNSINFFPPTTE